VLAGREGRVGEGDKKRVYDEEGEKEPGGKG